MVNFKVALKNYIHISLTDKDFESIGTTAEAATEKDIYNLLNNRLSLCADYDDFSFVEEV